MCQRRNKCSWQHVNLKDSSLSAMTAKQKAPFVTPGHRQIHWRAHSCHVISHHLTRDTQHPQPQQNAIMALPGQRSELVLCTKVNKPWRRAIEGMHWTELLVQNTIFFNEENDQKGNVTEQAFSYGVALSCSGFLLMPKSSFMDFPRRNKNTLTV